jgi:hypothetical protein
MKNFLVLLLFISWSCGSLHAQNNASCDQGKKIAENIWEKTGPWKPNITLNPWKKMRNTVRNHWNWISSNGVTTIGPRMIEIGEGNEEGTISGQTQRTFVTPPVFEDNVTLTINKYDGKAKTDIRVCLHSQNGNLTNEHTYTFPNDNDAKTKTFNISDTRGKIIIVSMRNRSVGNNFKYRIRMD